MWRRPEDGVLELRLNRATKRNALSIAMLEELRARLGEVAVDAYRSAPDSTRVLVLSGDGPAFSAGHDLGEMSRMARDRDQEGLQDVFALCNEVMQMIPKLPVPVVAKVDGIATAAGCQLVAACDLAVASSRSRFATPGVSIGLFCSTPAVPISRAVGRKRAMEMLLTGDMIGADEALNAGLLNRVVEADDLEATVDELAGRIATKSATAIRMGKATFYSQLEAASLAEAYGLAGQTMVDNMLTPDAREGIGAFLEKRPPVWAWNSGEVTAASEGGGGGGAQEERRRKRNR